MTVQEAVAKAREIDDRIAAVIKAETGATVDVTTWPVADGSMKMSIAGEPPAVIAARVVVNLVKGAAPDGVSVDPQDPSYVVAFYAITG